MFVSTHHPVPGKKDPWWDALRAFTHPQAWGGVKSLPFANTEFSPVPSCYALRSKIAGMIVTGTHVADMPVRTGQLNPIGGSTDAGTNCSSDHNQRFQKETTGDFRKIVFDPA